VNYVAGQTGFPHRTFFWLDAFACVTWVGYSIGVGLLAGQWVHNNPLLGVGIAVVFAVLLGVAIDHILRWWHKRLGRNDVIAVAEAEAKAVLEGESARGAR
jgi:membrane protein DedA with SNARE-associated domain